MHENDILDRILQQIGNFGRQQVVVFSLICVVVAINSATHIAYVFTALDSDYRCIIPECDDVNPEYKPRWIENAIPFRTKNVPEKCDMFTFVNETNSYANCSAESFNRNSTVRCNSFVFRDNEHYIARDFNLLCDDNLWKLTSVGTINTIGMFFGLLITGIISDRYGRKFVLLVGMSLSGATGVMKSFSTTFEWFCFYEFLEAVFGAGTYGCGFILGVELVTPEKRGLSGSITSSFYALGEVLLAIVAWWVKDWKLIIYILYIPSILVIFFYWSIPDSIRWYLSKGRVAEAKNILRNFARANGKEISEEYLGKLKPMAKEQQEQQENVSIMEMLKSTTLLLRFLNCSFCWIVCAFLFYGLTLTSVALSSNSYINFIYISLTEIPAYFLAAYISEKFGRKYSLSGSFFITAISCTAFIFIGGESEWLHILVYCVGKFGATSAFILIYVVASEMFPTSLRHTTMGVCSMIGRFGSATSPQVPLLSRLWTHLPLVTFASLAAISGVTSLFFPETLNIILPNTIREAENIGKSSEKKKTVNLF